MLALIPAAIVGYVACAGEDEIDDANTAEVQEEAIGPVDAHLVGTYRNEPAKSAGRESAGSR